MIRPVAFLKWCGGLALLAAAFALSPVAASADSFSFGYHSGPGYYRPYPHHYPHHRHPHWGPSYGASVIFVQPPPVVYAPPPPVVYAPSVALNAAPASAPYRTSDGRYCREYQATVVVNGVPQPSYGTACLGPDGAWRVVN